jgi:lipooligosaccharide transport system permease protein
VVRLSPLYHSAQLLRELTTGTVGLASLWHVLVLALLGVVGMVVTGRRLEKLLLT